MSITITCVPSAAPVGVSYLQQFAASGGTGPYTWAITGGALPPGLSLIPSGTFAGYVYGYPTTAGNYSYTVTATDSLLATGSQSCTIYCLSIAGPLLGQTVIGAAYGVATSVTGAGGVGPFVYAIAGGALPPGLSINTGTGHINGTATAGGVWPFTASYTDSLGNTISGTFSIVPGTGFDASTLSIQVWEPALQYTIQDENPPSVPNNTVNDITVLGGNVSSDIGAAPSGGFTCSMAFDGAITPPSAVQYSPDGANWFAGTLGTDIPFSPGDNPPSSFTSDLSSIIWNDYQGVFESFSEFATAVYPSFGFNYWLEGYLEQIASTNLGLPNSTAQGQGVYSSTLGYSAWVLTDTISGSSIVGYGVIFGIPFYRVTPPIAVGLGSSMAASCIDRSEAQGLFMIADVQMDGSLQIATSPDAGTWNPAVLVDAAGTFPSGGTLILRWMPALNAWFIYCSALTGNNYGYCSTDGGVTWSRFDGPNFSLPGGQFRYTCASWANDIGGVNNGVLLMGVYANGFVPPGVVWTNDGANFNYLSSGLPSNGDMYGAMSYSYGLKRFVSACTYVMPPDVIPRNYPKMVTIGLTPIQIGGNYVSNKGGLVNVGNYVV